MNDQPHNPAHHRETAHRLARFALFAFLVTFILSRVCVFLIMAKAMPNLYCFLAVLALLGLFGAVIDLASLKLGDLVGPKLQELESASSP
jgi:hypothetical protein